MDILSERWSAIGPIVGKPSGMVLQVDPSGHLKGPDRERVARAAAEIPAMYRLARFVAGPQSPEHEQYAKELASEILDGIDGEPVTGE